MKEEKAEEARAKDTKTKKDPKPDKTSARMTDEPAEAEDKGLGEEIDGHDDDSKDAAAKPKAKAKGKAKAKAKGKSRAKAKAKGRSKRNRVEDEDSEEEEPDSLDELQEEAEPELPPAPVRRKSGKQPPKKIKDSDELSELLCDKLKSEIRETVQPSKGLMFSRLVNKIKKEKTEFDVCSIEYYWTRPAVGLKDLTPAKKEFAYFGFGKAKFNYSLATAATCANILAAWQA